MLNILDSKQPYILISPERVNNTSQENGISFNKAWNILSAKEYHTVSITGYENESYDNSLIAFNSTDNNTLRMDAIHLMDMFQLESITVKYNGEEDATKISRDGSERPLGLLVYDSIHNSKKYLLDGVSFSFFEKKRYFFPKRKEELKNGQIVEYYNNNKWISKEVSNLEIEWDKLYKLLIKYEKVRIECK